MCEVKQFADPSGNVWKYVFHFEDAIAEAVLYRYGTFKERTVMCVSVQSGCPVGCVFCGTGKKFIRNLTIDEIEYQDFRTVKESEGCPNCKNTLRVVKAIELGHIFKLGTKYSDALGANFLSAEGKEKPIIMGSYGIGVERILACFIEQNSDENGIIWKNPLKPFDIHLIGLNISKFEEISQTCENIYKELKQNNIDVLYDDRNESAGVKFNDADLIGIPIQIIIGKKNLDNGLVEIKNRQSGERETKKIEDVIPFIISKV